VIEEREFGRKKCIDRLEVETVIGITGPLCDIEC
jgi:hypothetical protein